MPDPPYSSASAYHKETVQLTEVLREGNAIGTTHPYVLRQVRERLPSTAIPRALVNSSDWEKKIMRIAVQPEVKILSVVRTRGHILLEQLLVCFPELSWNQVFLIVDRMNRQGLIGLRRRGFEYELYAPAASDCRATSSRTWINA